MGTEKSGAPVAGSSRTSVGAPGAGSAKTGLLTADPYRAPDASKVKPLKPAFGPTPCSGSSVPAAVPSLIMTTRPRLAAEPNPIPASKSGSAKVAGLDHIRRVAAIPALTRTRFISNLRGLYISEVDKVGVIVFRLGGNGI